MKVLFSTKDMDKMIMSLDIIDKDSLRRQMRPVIDKPMKDYKRMLRTSELFYRLLDGSYGQFVLSDRMDVMICSLGNKRLYGSEEKPYYGNCIYVFTYGGRIREWSPAFFVVAEDCYPEDVAFKEDTVKRITNLTKKYMKQFSIAINSIDKIEKLADSIRATY